MHNTQDFLSKFADPAAEQSLLKFSTFFIGKAVGANSGCRTAHVCKSSEGHIIARAAEESANGSQTPKQHYRKIYYDGEQPVVEMQIKIQISKTKWLFDTLLDKAF